MENYRELWMIVPTSWLVVLAPSRQDNVGLLDTYSNTFSTVSTAAAYVTGDNKYNGAAAVGSR